MNLKDHFPRASQAFLDANPYPPVPTVAEAKENALQPIVATRRGKMNGVEKEYAMILEAMKRKSEILRYEFEGITLRFAEVRYTPDFVVFSKILGCVNPAEVRLIEVKGPFIKGNRERAVERFRHAKTYWPEFTFELHQKTKEGWRQLI